MSISLIKLIMYLVAYFCIGLIVNVVIAIWDLESANYEQFIRDFDRDWGSGIATFVICMWPIAIVIECVMKFFEFSKNFTFNLAKKYFKWKNRHEIH